MSKTDLAERRKILNTDGNHLTLQDCPCLNKGYICKHYEGIGSNACKQEGGACNKYKEWVQRYLYDGVIENGSYDNP